MSIMAAFSCDGDNDVIDDDIDGTFFAGVTFALDFCQNGILVNIQISLLSLIWNKI